MNDNSFKNWQSMTDKVLSRHIGNFIKHKRLELNKTQEIVSQDAGISRSTLSLLERGQTVTMATFIQVLRVLDQLQIMDEFVVKESISPLAMAKKEMEQRKRAGNKKSIDNKKVNW